MAIVADVERLAALHRLLLTRSRQLQHYVAGKIPRDVADSFSAEDVLQEVWISAFRRHRATPLTKGDEAFRWLLLIANHVLVDFIRRVRAVRRGGRMSRVPLGSMEGPWTPGDPFAPAPTPSRAAAEHESKDAISEALNLLPESRRRVLEMYYFEGRSLREIAECTDRSAAAVGSLMYQARLHLRRLMGAAGRYFTDAD